MFAMVSPCSGAILAAFLIARRTAEILRPDKSGLRMTSRDIVDVVLSQAAEKGVAAALRRHMRVAMTEAVAT
jgi:hypothetical protein